MVALCVDERNHIILEVELGAVCRVSGGRSYAARILGCIRSAPVHGVKRKPDQVTAPQGPKTVNNQAFVRLLFSLGGRAWLRLCVPLQALKAEICTIL